MPARRGDSSAPSLALLRRLCNAVAVSGDESEVRKIVLGELEGLPVETRVDALGNLLVEHRGTGRRRLRVMVDAHMDEVGFMIVAEGVDGLFEFVSVGGVDSRGVAGKPVVIGRAKSAAVVGARAIHLLREEDLKRPLSVESLRIDLGPGGKASPGDRGTFAPNFRRVGPSVMSKALDDRLGVAILVELIKHPPAGIDLLASFTVQEEIGLRGAQVAAQYFKPEAAIVLDATPANDLPLQRDGENTGYNSRLGLGPVIYLSNKSTIDDPRLVAHVKATAIRKRIPFQIRQPGAGGTDAGAIQRAVGGVPVVSVSVPNRYPHTAVSIARIEDWRNTYRLVRAALQDLTPEVLSRGRRPRRTANTKRKGTR